MIEILVLPDGKAELGYRLLGSRNDRSYLIAGAAAIVEAVFDHLVASPDIGRLQAQLCLLKLEALDRPDLALPLFPKIGRFEDFMFLPYTPDLTDPLPITRLACWSAMRFCLHHGLLPERSLTANGDRLH